MARITRRQFLKLSSGSTLIVKTGGFAGLAAGWAPAEAQATPTVEQWMNNWMNVPMAPGGTLHLSRFREPMYFLTMPIAWKPNPDQVGIKFEAVHVPKGFVIDFASVPQAFWSLLRPDGEYTYPAIIHDFLYWTQTRPREEADEILKFSMQDFFIDPKTSTIIYKAVRVGGGSAWKKNARLKAQGEKRILIKFPDDPTVRWQDWKKRPDVFVS
jgi:hypothetical protein